MSDLISRADAIEAMRLETGKHGRELLGRGDILDIISALPSAEAEWIVIRSKTLLPTKDFKEWAKRIREVNPNAIVIPCDAEVVSAEAVEIVRCEDCIHYESDGGAMMICNITDMVCDNDDYCSYGERREDGKE